MTRVLHVIVGLEGGGAELMLERLIGLHHKEGRHRHAVVSLTSLGRIGERLRARGVDVRALGVHSPWGVAGALHELLRLIRTARPDIVQTWMYHADLLGGIAARLAGVSNVIWGVRSSTPLRVLSMSYATAKACALVSNIIPAVIACNAESGLRAHAGLGYNRRRMVAIPNGCDTIRFASSPALRARARTMFGFSSDDIVIGTIGRFAPHKDYRTFVRAAARLILANGRVRVLMAGRGLDSGNRVLQEWVAETGYPQRFVLAGEQDDSVACFSALDVFCLSSISEGFPNVVTEAMAMEVPCVVTDAGDARDIVGDTGWTVASGNADALAAALLVVVRASREDRAARGRQARQRVRSLFSVERTGAEFEGLYAGLVKRPGDRVDACFDDERTVQR